MKNKYSYSTLTKHALPVVALLLSFFFTSVSFSQDTAWTILPAPVEEGWLENLHFTGPDTGWVVGGYDNPSESYIAITYNEGDDWSVQLTTSDLLYAIHACDENNAWAVGKTVYKTTDGGIEWTEQQVFQSVYQYAQDVFCMNNTTVFLAGRDDNAQSCLIMHSLDGTNWTTPSYPPVNGRLNAIYFADDNHGWAVGKNILDNKPLVLYTSDGGANWVQQDQPFDQGELMSIHATDQMNAWAVGGTGYTSGDHSLLMITLDGGASWAAANPPPATMATSLDVFSDTSAMITTQTNAGGWQAGLYYTEDAGATWEPKLETLEDTWLEDVSIVTTTSRAMAKAYGGGSGNSGSTFGRADVAIASAEQMLAYIQITPLNADLTVGGSQLYTAEGFDQNGQPMNPPISPYWTTDGGTITQDGEYTAPDQPGDYTVTAEVEGSDVTGTAYAHVTPAEQQLAEIRITPPTKDMQVGDAQLFTAQGYDQFGNPMNQSITPEWAADGGTINQQGKFTAPDEEANITVTASAESDKELVTGKASVKVRKPGTLLTLVLDPDSISIPNGGQQSFGLTGYDILDDMVDLQSSGQWAASGGTVTQDGIYTAPDADGIYAVEVMMLVTLNSEAYAPGRQQIDTVTGSATVVVGETYVGEYQANHKLYGNRPNPFRSQTEVKYRLDRPGYARLMIADESGRVKMHIFSDYQQQGEHAVRIQTANWPAGIYYCILRFEGKLSAIRLIKL